MIEIRFTDILKLDDILDLAGALGTGIGLGSECCVHKLPPLELVGNISGLTEALTIVIPITPQRHYDLIMDYVGQLPPGLRLVLNDVGILFSLHNENMLAGFDGIIAGRGIVHTSEACPWVDHLLRDESLPIRDAFLKTNLNYSRTLDFFKTLGISGMETDLEPRTVKAALETGLPVSALAEYTAVSYARSCHTARFYDERPPECITRCNAPIALELVDMFDLSSVPPGFAQPSEKLVNIFPTLYLLGNTIFMKSDCKDIQGLERVIINADMYSLESLGDKIDSFIER